ncbi:MAG: hypothetical protein HFE97_08595 [Oscillospiraceae bacterium]|nr:hypothetical protein [Oscillospiraceae bacterium]
MQYTPYYKLHQWDPYDKHKRKEFNQDLAKVDAAIQTVKASGDAALQALRATVNANAAAAQQAVEGRCQMVAGTFVGDGTQGRLIVLPFTPAVVIVELTYGIRSPDDLTLYGGIALPGHALFSHSKVAMTVVEGGFQVNQGVDNKIYLNMYGRTYYYLALR